MNFKECLLECSKNKSLIAEFDRLNGTNLSLKGSQLELMIDRATGRIDEDLHKFVEFVHEVVWLRLGKSLGSSDQQN